MQSEATPRPLSVHKAIIAELVSEGCSTRGFHSAMSAAIGGQHVETEPHSSKSCDHCMIRDDLKSLREYGAIVPDAFKIVEEESTIIAFEVEVSNPISEFKMARYLDYWWALDEFYWSLQLVSVDRFRNRKPMPLNHAL